MSHKMLLLVQKNIALETMRLFPPATIFTRYCNETAKITEDITIEEGVTTMWYTPSNEQ